MHRGWCHESEAISLTYPQNSGGDHEVPHWLGARLLMADQDPSLSWVGECALKLNAGRGQHSGIWPHTWLSHLLNLVRSSHPVNIGPDIFGHR